MWVEMTDCGAKATQNIGVGHGCICMSVSEEQFVRYCTLNIVRALCAEILDGFDFGRDCGHRWLS